ncbi:MAG: ankyrin repeat domain-containing protein [Alphaproteobacteria bacterium]|nr:ankyrin repeat domain-containing protein [Alphaproteobacteria bacterium]
MFALKRFLIVAGFTCLLLPVFGMGAVAQSPQYELLKAVDSQDIKKATELLAQGISPDTRRRSDRFPALLIAVEKNNMAMMKLLLDNGANVNVGDPERGETALMKRALAGDVNGVQLLLSYGADANRADIGQETALMKAVRARKFKMVQTLLEAGADPNVQDFTGKTALEYAKLSRNRRMVRLLEDAGATY